MNILARIFGSSENTTTIVEGAVAGLDKLVFTEEERAETDEKARDWFVRFEGAGLDGVIAKPAAGHYVPDKRVQFKVKHLRTADCVVAGWRPHKQPGPDGPPVVGSLMTLT